MKPNVKITEVPNKPDYYDLTIKTYKDTLSGRFERSELRELIMVIDNAIQKTMDYDKKDLPKKNKCLNCGEPTANLYFCSMKCCLDKKEIKIIQL